MKKTIPAKHGGMDDDPLEAADTPVIFWASAPVGPGETVLVIGHGFDEDCRVRVARLRDDAAGHPGQGSASAGCSWKTARILQVGRASVKFVLPARAKTGCFAFQVGNGRHWSETQVLNRAYLNWHLGEDGARVRPGGELRLYGRQLRLNPKRRPTAMLRQAGGRWRVLPVEQASEYAAVFRVRPALPPGRYEVRLHNGFGGANGWSNPLVVEVARAQPWPATVYNIRDYGATGNGEDATDAITQALQAAEKNGGGVVFIPCGRYLISRTLHLPRQTILRGERVERTVLLGATRDDAGVDLEQVVKGTGQFGIEELQFQFIFAKRGIEAGITANDYGEELRAGDVFLRRVWFYHQRFMGQIGRPLADLGPRFDKEKMQRENWVTIHLAGNNLRIEQCRFLGAHRTLRLICPRNSLIADSVIGIGRDGFYELRSARRVAIENCEFYGQDWTSSGGAIAYPTPCVEHVYLSRNRFHDIFGHDREAITTDQFGRGVWHGAVQVAPDSVTVAGAKWEEDSLVDWYALVTAGRGRGQWRRIRANNQNTAFLEQPWSVVPDAQSKVAISRWKHDLVVVNNHFENTGAAFQSFGIGHDFVIQGNTATRAQGFGVSSLLTNEGWLKQEGWWDKGTWLAEGDYDQRAMSCGFEPNHYMQFIANRIAQSGMCWSDTYGRVVGPKPIPEALLMGAPQTIGVVFRRNQFEDDSQIKISSAEINHQLSFKLAEDFLIEGNHFRNCRVGIAIDCTNRQVLIRKNKYDRVDQLRVVHSAETVIDEP